MILRKILKKGKKFRLMIEDHPPIDLSETLLFDLGLRSGVDLDYSTLEKIIAASNHEKARDSALRILARRSHSVLELKRKLRVRGFGEDIITTLLDDLKDKGYLDDRKFTDEFISSKIRLRKEGPNKLKAMLKAKGIKDEIINEYLKDLGPEETVKNAMLLAKKKMRLFTPEMEEKEKKLSLQRYLYRKGYSKNDIDSVVNNLIKILN